ncbi:MAG: hypothetical protein QOE51_2556 [Actinoplanes sp.]|nr:hypothetical protein [Actinoplanes sp.]
MRYRLALVALAVLAFASGCGNPPGVDGNLISGWEAMSVPTGFIPGAGTCHLGNFAPVGTRAAYDESGCAMKHRSETVYVGTYADPAAQAGSPPAEGSAGARAAYAVCDLKTASYVGGPWRTARLWIGVTHPSAAAWTGGARWYRCEVLEISSIEDAGGPVQRTGSLRDAVADRSTGPLLSCYAIQLDSGGSIRTMPAAPCTAKHNAEFVGVWNAGDDLAYPKSDKLWATFHDGCRNVIASYVGVPNDANQEYRTGVVSLPGGEDVWGLGDHGVRCYLWVDGVTLTASLKGKGADGLPILYK